MALAADPNVQASVQRMVDDRNSGKRERDPMTAYIHNDLIRDIFKKAQRKAWASIITRPEVQELIQEQRQAKIDVQNDKRQAQLEALLLKNK